MATRDLHSHIKTVTHVAAQAITATNTPASGVDTKGFEAAEFLISVGTVTNIANSPQPTWTFKLEDSDDASSNFEAVTDSTLVLTGSAKSPVTTPDASTGVFLTIDDAAEDATTYRVGYVGPKRYVRVVATAANTPGSTPYSVVAVLGRAALEPTAD
ncbi:MAG: hypothetical protein JJ939_12090 [Alphaproteobacteria bacterium]|nr:hypothetical protein [Alphaproteobacteria bacterium]MBO6629153.1 hypothetical protein [Alphaproteobacteria bacterium]